MTATRLADICAMIDGHTAAGTMSGERVAAICAMIDNRHTAAETSSKRGWRWRVDSTRCYGQMRRLGKGAFGLVVKAQHRATGQVVAIKTIRARDGRKRPDVSELLREACFLAACRGHPCLVGLLGVARNPDTKEYCLVMEYVGPSLRHALDEHMERHGRPFPESDVRRFMRQLLSGVEAMHERRIIHRDIKPANILVREGGNLAKISDYGVAMSTAKAEPPYTQAGTVWYMAPEMLLQKADYYALVDLWSLGCVMAELLSGEVLFKGEEDKDQLHKIFDALGVPGKITWQAFKPTVLADEVQQWRAREQRVRHRDRLRELFPEDVLSLDGFDVLKGLLTCNPNKRLTAAASLRCPWFTGDAPAADDASNSKIGATALLRQMALSLLIWGLISAWALFRQMALSLVRLPIGSSALLRHKTLSKRTLHST